MRPVGRTRHPRRRIRGLSRVPRVPPGLLHASRLPAKKPSTRSRQQGRSQRRLPSHRHPDAAPTANAAPAERGAPPTTPWAPAAPRKPAKACRRRAGQQAVRLAGAPTRLNNQAASLTLGSGWPPASSTKQTERKCQNIPRSRTDSRAPETLQINNAQKQQQGAGLRPAASRATHHPLVQWFRNRGAIIPESWCNDSGICNWRNRRIYAIKNLHPCEPAPRPGPCRAASFAFDGR